MKHFFKRIGHWFDDRTGWSENILPIIKHPVPPNVGWSYVFGSAVLFCFVLQVLTGIALAFMYQPSVESVYESLQYIRHEAFMGNIIRGLHFFGASGMVTLVGIHMIRVYLTASYRYPREMSWISGVFLLLLVVAMGFTGQLLRWDDEALWSTFVAAEQMGRIPIIGDAIGHLLIAGETINGFTLNRFFSFHVFVFPGIMMMLIGLHLYLVIRNGISEPPVVGRKLIPGVYRKWYDKMIKEKGEPFFPNAAWRDAIFITLVFGVILSLAIVVGAPPLKAEPDPQHVLSHPRPDWYLKWIFALYAMMPPEIEPYLIFFGPLVVISLLLIYPFLSKTGQRHPIRRPWAIAGVVVTIGIVAFFTFMGFKSPWAPKFDTKPLTEAMVFSPKLQPGAQLFYDKGCQYCHSINGYGGSHGPNLSKVGEHRTREHIMIQIVNGGKEMPAYGGILSSQEMEDIITFLKEFKAADYPHKKGKLPAKKAKQRSKKRDFPVKEAEEKPD